MFKNHFYRSLNATLKANKVFTSGNIFIIALLKLKIPCKKVTQQKYLWTGWNQGSSGVEMGCLT